MRKTILLLTIAIFTSAAAVLAQSEPIVLISTSYGDVKVKLYNETPLHRDNFLELVKSGLLDTWDYQMIHMIVIQKGYTIVPFANLTSNIVRIIKLIFFIL